MARVDEAHIHDNRDHVPTLSALYSNTHITNAGAPTTEDQLRLHVHQVKKGLLPPTKRLLATTPTVENNTLFEQTDWTRTYASSKPTAAPCALWRGRTVVINSTHHTPTLLTRVFKLPGHHCNTH